MFRNACVAQQSSRCGEYTLDDIFQLAVEASPAAMILVGPDGRIQHVNAECERMFRYSRGELIGALIETLVPGSVKEQHTKLRDSFVARPSKRLMGVGRDLRAMRRDGQEFSVEIGLTPIPTSAGLNVLAFVVDITGRREAEDMMRLALVELEQANRSLEQFAYVASHDIQEPLRKILAFGDVLRTAMADDDRDEAAHASAVMQASALRARELVSALLDLARSINYEYKFAAVSFKTLVEDALSDCSEIIQKSKAEVTVDVADTIVRADRLHATRLIENIISNALKYCKPDEPPCVRIAFDRVDGGWRLAIEDKGIGFDPTRASELFEPFKRLHTQDRYAGSGIGLAVCRTIAQRHGWTLSARSTPSVGSTFEIAGRA
jgi:PAS domain S-box-containing protein